MNMDIERRKKYFKRLLPDEVLTKEFKEDPEKKIEIQEQPHTHSVEAWTEEELRTLKFE
jgi:hypothetical protein